jgi:cell wall-active antibiotic response 4TMS protein YvqF
VAMKPRLSSQVVVGLMVIAVGVIFTLDNLGIIYAEDYLRYWPIGLVLIGAVKVWHARKDGQGWFSGLLFLGVGSYMLINHLIYIRLDAREILPLFLVFLGGFMVWRGVFGRARSSRFGDGLSRFSSLAVMGGVARRSNSPQFEGADLTAIMGGCDVDLRDASIAPNTEAIIDVFAFWGGIDLKVPEDWVIVNRVIPLMGGVDDKTRTPIASSEPQKRLVVRGIVIMGGIAIRNRSRRDDIRNGVSDARSLRDEIRQNIRDNIRSNIRQCSRDDDRR